MTFCIVSATGKDRPGFVHEITHVIKQTGGNIEQQRSVRVADEYAVMILFTVPGEDAADSALGALRRLAHDDFVVHARRTNAPLTAAAAGAQPAEIQASGADQPGILDALTSVLLHHRINIDAMDFDTQSAPMTGEPLFCMKARVSIPDAVDLRLLRQQFRDLEDEYNFDILFRSPA